jgi:hypothetical protein
MTTIEEMQAELERLRIENINLKKQTGKTKEITLKVSPKQAVSIYHGSRFPTTLYPETLLRILDKADDIRAFIEENKANLSWTPTTAADSK